jgi:hypothetical protein
MTGPGRGRPCGPCYPGRARGMHDHARYDLRTKTEVVDLALRRLATEPLTPRRR